MKVDLPDIKNVKSGSTNVKKICRGSRELWPNYQKSIIIHGYITPNTYNVKAIDLGIHPTKDTKLELYIQNKSGNLGNGSTNLGLGTTVDGAGGTYPDSNDWRFFWTSLFYFDMASSRTNFYLNSSSYYNKMIKFECGRTGMKAYLCSTNKQLNYVPMNVTGTFTWSNANLVLEPYHSNNGYMSWYLIRIYEGDNKIMELYPAQKSDYGWCFKDNVSGNYFYNPEAAPWIYTESNESIEIEP